MSLFLDINIKYMFTTMTHCLYIPQNWFNALVRDLCPTLLRNDNALMCLRKDTKNRFPIWTKQSTLCGGLV